VRILSCSCHLSTARHCITDDRTYSQVCGNLFSGKDVSVLSPLSTVTWRQGGVEVQHHHFRPQHHYMEVSGQFHSLTTLAPWLWPIGGWVRPRTGLDSEEKRKKSCLCRESNPGGPARSLSVYRLFIISLH
jgi:hypothetical protein